MSKLYRTVLNGSKTAVSRAQLARVLRKRFIAGDSVYYTVGTIVNTFWVSGISEAPCSYSHYARICKSVLASKLNHDEWLIAVVTAKVLSFLIPFDVMTNTRSWRPGKYLSLSVISRDHHYDGTILASSKLAKLDVANAAVAYTQVKTFYSEGVPREWLFGVGVAIGYEFGVEAHARNTVSAIRVGLMRTDERILLHFMDTRIVSFTHRRKQPVTTDFSFVALTRDLDQSDMDTFCSRYGQIRRDQIDELAYMPIDEDFNFDLRAGTALVLRTAKTIVSFMDLVQPFLMVKTYARLCFYLRLYCLSSMSEADALEVALAYDELASLLERTVFREIAVRTSSVFRDVYAAKDYG